MTLYAAKGSGSASDLYTMNSTTGVGTSVGPTGYSITGLAFHPATSALYGVTGGSDPTNPKSLLLIDKTTGAATLIGALGSTGPIPDICFTSDGTLWGVDSTGTSHLYTINLSTGAATSIGSLGRSTFGNGIESDALDNLILFPRGSHGDYHSVNKTTGALTLLGTLTTQPNPSNVSASIAAASFGPDSRLYAVSNYISTNIWLETISSDGSQHGIASIAGSPQWDALAWDTQARVLFAPVTLGYSDFDPNVSNAYMADSGTRIGDKQIWGVTNETDTLDGFSSSEQRLTTFTIKPGSMPPSGTYHVKVKWQYSGTRPSNAHPYIGIKRNGLPIDAAYEGALTSTSLTETITDNTYPHPNICQFGLPPVIPLQQSDTIGVCVWQDAYNATLPLTGWPEVEQLTFSATGGDPGTAPAVAADPSEHPLGWTSDPPDSLITDATYDIESWAMTAFPNGDVYLFTHELKGSSFTSTYQSSFVLWKYSGGSWSTVTNDVWGHGAGVFYTTRGSYSSMAICRNNLDEIFLVWGEDDGTRTARTLTNATTDNFNRANETPLTNYTLINSGDGAINLASNQVQPVGAGRSTAKYALVSLANDELSEVTVKTPPGAGNYIGACVRITGAGTTTPTFYELRAIGAGNSSDTMELWKCVAGTFTLLQSATVPNCCTAGSTIVLNAVGTSLQCGWVKTTGYTGPAPPYTRAFVVTDSSITVVSGNVGFSMSGGVADDWGYASYPTTVFEANYHWRCKKYDTLTNTFTELGTGQAAYPGGDYFPCDAGYGEGGEMRVECDPSGDPWVVWTEAGVSDSIAAGDGFYGYQNHEAWLAHWNGASWDLEQVPAPPSYAYNNPGTLDATHHRSLFYQIFSVDIDPNIPSVDLTFCHHDGPSSTPSVAYDCFVNYSTDGGSWSGGTGHYTFIYSEWDGAAWSLTLEQQEIGSIFTPYSADTVATNDDVNSFNAFNQGWALIDNGVQPYMIWAGGSSFQGGGKVSVMRIKTDGSGFEAYAGHAHPDDVQGPWGLSGADGVFVNGRLVVMFGDDSVFEPVVVQDVEMGTGTGWMPLSKKGSTLTEDDSGRFPIMCTDGTYVYVAFGTAGWSNKADTLTSDIVYNVWRLNVSAAVARRLSVIRYR